MAIARTFEEFEQLLQQRADEAGTSLRIAGQSAGRAIGRELVLRTPRKTGRARLNWRATSGASRGTYIQSSPGPEIATSTALQRVTRGASLWNPARGPLTFSNFAPYIGELDRGTSHQAPANFTQHAKVAGLVEWQRSRIWSPR